MEFAKRMERFETGIFSKLLDLKSARLAAGGTVVDMSIGAPNLAPAEHVMRALADAAMDPKNYIYAIQDLNELHQAVAAWYQRRYGAGVISDSQCSRGDAWCDVCGTVGI